MPSTQALTAAGKRRLDEATATIRAEAAHFADIARDRAASARDRAGAELSRRKESARHAVGDYASAARAASDDLAGNHRHVSAKVAGHAADRLNGLAGVSALAATPALLSALRKSRGGKAAVFVGAGVLLGVAAMKVFELVGRKNRKAGFAAAVGGEAPWPADEATTLDADAAGLKAPLADDLGGLREEDPKTSVTGLGSRPL